jgi:hypothetical protein
MEVYLIGLFTMYFDNELWKTDGTQTGTEIISTLYGGDFLESTVVNNVLYFTTGIARLWRTDGSVCGTYQVLAHAQLGDVTYANGKILLAYQSPTVGRELFIFTPSPSGCEPLVQGASLDQIPQVIADEENVISYPNPFVNEFSIRVNGDEGESCQAIIVDAKGVQQGDIMQLQSNREYNLGSELIPGVYVLILNKPDRRIVQKIMKQ